MPMKVAMKALASSVQFSCSAEQIYETLSHCKSDKK
jgi:hypothetical protein